MTAIRPRRFLGVTFVSRALGDKKWRAQVVRQGMVISLGSFVTQEEAARSYDNASYHLANWSDQVSRYNFPAEWAGETVPGISTFSSRGLAKLRERFPNWEREKEAMQSLSEFDRVQRDGLAAVAATTLNMDRVRTCILWCFGQLKLQDQKLRDHAEELAQRDRVISGLRITGGKPFMKAVSSLNQEAAKPVELIDPV